MLCQKTKTVRKDGRISGYEVLSDLQTFEAADTLIDAAEICDDERVLLAIKDQDLVAIEVKYHKSCYRNYTNAKTLERIKMKNEQASEQKSIYDKAFAFDKIAKIVKDTVVDGSAIVRMSDLKRQYTAFLLDEGLDAPDYRSEKLKSRLLKRFGDDIGFWHPRYRSKSEIVFSEAIPKGQLIEETLSQQEEDDDHDFIIEVNEFDVTSEKSVILFKAAKIVRKMVLEHNAEVPFPLRPENIFEENIQIPNLLYNHLAWILSGLPDYVASGLVSQVSPQLHVRILSIAQDLLLVASNGMKRTLKHVALPMTIKCLTGSAEPITVLNRLGHRMSYTKVEEEETGMAERQIKNQQDGELIPSNTLAFSRSLLGIITIWMSAPHLDQGQLTVRMGLSYRKYPMSVKTRLKSLMLLTKCQNETRRDPWILHLFKYCLFPLAKEHHQEKWRSMKEHLTS